MKILIQETEPAVASTHDEWTEIIRPKRDVFDFRLHEVWRYRDLILLFIKRDFAAQYRQTVLGPIWHIIQPVFTTVMFMLVFNKIAGIPTRPLPPPLFYISSIAIWNYFASCLTATSNTFISNAGIFGKVYFPRLISPISNVLSNMIRFGIQFLLIIAFMVYYAGWGGYIPEIGLHILLIPAILVLMALLGLGLGIIISSMTTKYRDLTVLINFGVGLLMYVTPVAYPLSYLEQSRYRTLIQWNPLSPFVEGFRYALFGYGSFDQFYFIYAIVFTLVVLFIGITMFNRVERTFLDTV